VARQALFLIVILLALLSVFLAEALVGVYNVSVKDFWNYLTGGPVDSKAATVLDVRVRRALTALAVGAIMGAATMALQSSLRNVLASPFTLGVQHAAALGAAVAIMSLYGGAVTRWFVTVTNPFFVASLAFLGALGQTLLVLALSTLGGMTVYAVVLVSVAMSFVVQAVLSLLQYLYFNEILVAALVFWTFGDVGRTGWTEVYILAATAAATVALFTLYALDLDLLAVGDDVAQSSGVDPRRARLLFLVTSALATAVAVSFVGVVGFVGLEAAVVARQIAGWSNRRSLPLAAAVGALALTAADLLGRTIIAPTVIPVGIMTTLTGAPAMIYLVIQRRHVH